MNGAAHELEMRNLIRKYIQHGGTAAFQMGETRRINHADCPAGEDTKARLYLTRPIDTRGVVVLGYCHNCAVGVAVSLNETTRARGSWKHNPAKPRTEAQDAHAYHELTQRLVHDDAEWPCAMRTHLVEQGISETEFRLLGMTCTGYDPVCNARVTPLWDLESDLVGYQSRNLDGVGPKFITYYKDSNDKGTGYYWHSVVSIAETPRVLMLVEDAMSAFAVWMRGGQIATLAIGSSNVSTDKLAAILNANKSDFIGVALDNDSDSVCANAQSIVKRIQLLGRKAYMHVGHTQDPKYWSAEVIENAKVVTMKGAR